jgi:uncharacterized protein YegP (UPF0339 family)
MTTVTVQVYESRRPLGRQKWRWRAVSSNGRILANSGEAYTNLSECQEAVLVLFGTAAVRVTLQWSLTSANHWFVFVRYGADKHSKATNPSMLRLVVEQ